MDKSSVLGLVLGFGAMIGMVLIEGDELAGLMNTAAALIVFGGTFGALLVSFPLAEVLALPKAIAKAFGAEIELEKEAVDFYVTMADKARRGGLLALEPEVETITDRFVRKGFMLAVDGTDPEVVRVVMENELEKLGERHEQKIHMLEAMGGFAPTMGILGTVMGLVHVLSQLSEPAALGESIAAAFVATLYGVASANVLWLPLANKLRVKSQLEKGTRRLALEALLAIQAGDNPHIVREKLEAHLAPKARAPKAVTAENPQPVPSTA